MYVFFQFVFIPEEVPAGGPSKFPAEGLPSIGPPSQVRGSFWDPQIQPKSIKHGVQNGPKSIPERPGDTLARPRGALVHLGGLRVAFGLHVGTLLEPFWDYVGPSLGHVGSIWPHLGTFRAHSGAFWANFRTTWDHLR